MADRLLAQAKSTDEKSWDECTARGDILDVRAVAQVSIVEGGGTCICDKPDEAEWRMMLWFAACWPLLLSAGITGLSVIFDDIIRLQWTLSIRGEHQHGAPALITGRGCLWSL